MSEQLGNDAELPTAALREGCKVLTLTPCQRRQDCLHFFGRNPAFFGQPFM
jgi:hypothetical protein